MPLSCTCYISSIERHLSTQGGPVCFPVQIGIMYTFPTSSVVPITHLKGSTEAENLLLMNHDSGFIIGITYVFCKNSNRMHA